MQRKAVTDGYYTAALLAHLNVDVDGYTLMDTTLPLPAHVIVDVDVDGYYTASPCRCCRCW